MDTLVKRKRIKNLESRIIGLLAIIAQIIYLYAIIKGFNQDYPVVSAIFIGFQIIVFLTFLLYVINNWTLEVPVRKLVKEGFEQNVAIIIPTWNEPVEMVENTVLSVIQQNYPKRKILIVVSDDAKNPEMKGMVFNLGVKYPDVRILYNVPPEKGSSLRKGEGKAGNLNSAFKLILNECPGIEFIETRDADDLVGSQNFLRDTIGQLVSEPQLAYVQTIKEVLASESDPFGNKESSFFKSLMLYKNGANAVFPCGSGVVWRKNALLSIGGFPDWNLVEDFQSGAEALRKGWKGMYLPITGAIGQISPEDLPNLYKQRGTWAMDSFRFFFWGNKKGLTLRQKLHFAESAIAYFMSILSYFYAFIPAILLIFRVTPVNFYGIESALFQSTQVLSVIVFTMCLVSKGDVSFSSVMRSTQTLLGVFPALLKSMILTLVYGQNRKPSYKVTRKKHVHGIYIFSVTPQLLLVTILIFAIIYHINQSVTVASVDFSNIIWCLYFIYIYKQVIQNSIFKWTEVFRKNRKVEAIQKYSPDFLLRFKTQNTRVILHK